MRRVMIALAALAGLLCGPAANAKQKPPPPPDPLQAVGPPVGPAQPFSVAKVVVDLKAGTEWAEIADARKYLNAHR